MKFNDFLRKVENNTYETTVNARGAITIQQTVRNKLRAEGQQALFEDLKALYPDFDCLLTADGIVFVSPNKDFDFSFQIKTTIPSTDYNAYDEADSYERTVKMKAEKKAEQEKAKKARLERQQKLRQEYIASNGNKPAPSEDLLDEFDI